MKTAFFHDSVFVYDENNIYTRGPLNTELFNGYKKHFGDILTVTRYYTKNDNTLKYINEKNRIDGVDYVLINSKYKDAIQKVKETMNKVDFAIIRLPSIIGSIAFHYAQKNKIPYLVELVGCPFDSLKNHGKFTFKIAAPFMYLITKNIVKKAPNVVYVTDKFLQERYKNNYNNIGCSDVNLISLDDAILTRRIDKIKNINEDYIYKLGIIGSLNVNYKGHEQAIKTVSILKDKLTCELHFLGDGNTKKWLDISKKYGIEDRVFFDGTLPSGIKVLEWLDDKDIYLIPSKVEGLPRALIEAMSRACPAIGNKIGGIVELIPNEYLINKDDYKKMAELVYRVLIDKKEMIEIACTNFSKSKEYDKKVLSSKKNKFYKSIVNLK